MSNYMNISQQRTSPLLTSMAFSWSSCVKLHRLNYLQDSLLLVKKESSWACSTEIRQGLRYSGHTQSIRYARSTSEPLQITSGVPQDSMVGLLIFIIYFNDLHPSSTILACAGDVTLVATGEMSEVAVGTLQSLMNAVTT